MARVGRLESVDGGLDGKGGLADARWAVDLSDRATREASGRRDRVVGLKGQVEAW